VTDGGTIFIVDTRKVSAELAVGVADTGEASLGLGEASRGRRSHCRAPPCTFYRDSLRKYAGRCINV
jgi:hypothetical protein